MQTMTRVIALTLVLMTLSVRAADVGFEKVFEALWFESPIFLTHVPDGSNRLVVAQQNGIVYVFPNRPDVRADERIQSLDLSAQVKSPGQHGGHNEEGLLGLAFAPDFARSRHVYLHYSTRDPRAKANTSNVLVRFTMNGQGIIDPASQHEILRVPQPYTNHNGGMIAFGPDGYLYLALGDGGAGGDPHRHGQNPRTLLGAILRLDVIRSTPKQPYAIPPDNPFAHGGGRPEIYAYGLRNPWRFSFDAKTGQLWAGDVGQNRLEEIDLITSGGNYGWNAREGFSPFKNRQKTRDMIDPVVEHPHSQAKSITGGYVYRGQALPALHGTYVYGDFVTSAIWMLPPDQHQRQPATPLKLGEVRNVASFGVDEQGELYACSFGGSLFKLQAKRR